MFCCKCFSLLIVFKCKNQETCNLFWLCIQLLYIFNEYIIYQEKYELSSVSERDLEEEKFCEFYKNIKYIVQYYEDFYGEFDFLELKVKELQMKITMYCLIYIIEV